MDISGTCDDPARVQQQNGRRNLFRRLIGSRRDSSDCAMHGLQFIQRGRRKCPHVPIMPPILRPTKPWHLDALDDEQILHSREDKTSQHETTKHFMATWFRPENLFDTSRCSSRRRVVSTRRQICNPRSRKFGSSRRRGHLCRGNCG